jgi:hypothetical protein
MSWTVRETISKLKKYSSYLLENEISLAVFFHKSVDKSYSQSLGAFVSAERTLIMKVVIVS